MNIEILRKSFEKILATETRAKNFYDHYIDQIDDENMKEQLISIRDEEAAHIKIAEKLLEYVS